MKKIILIFCILLFGNFCFSAETHLLNEDLFSLKNELHDMYYKASSTGKLSKKEIAMLDKIKAATDVNKKDGNTNSAPIYYELGNTYRAIGMKDEAISCYRTIVRYYPNTVFRKKAIVNLKYLGETYTDENGKTIMYDYDDND